MMQVLDNVTLIMFYNDLDPVLALEIRIGSYSSMTLDYTVLDMRIVSNVNIVEDYRILYITVIADIRLLEDH